MYAIKKKFGFRDAPNAGFLACPLTPFYPAGSAARRLKYALAYTSSLSHRRRAEGLAGGHLSVAREFGAEFDVLAEKLVSGEALTPWKPSAYLRWRYRGCPGRSYRTLRLDGPDGLRGAIVLRGPEGPERTAWIVDLLADPGDTATVAALIRGARRELQARRASVVWMPATSARVRAQLLRAGFLETPRSLRFTYLAYAKLPFDPTEVEWNFYYGDGDCELYSDRTSTIAAEAQPFHTPSQEEDLAEIALLEQA